MIDNYLVGSILGVIALIIVAATIPQDTRMMDMILHGASFGVTK